MQSELQRRRERPKPCASTLPLAWNGAQQRPFRANKLGFTFFLMLALLRRSRSIALAMVLLAPGVSGSAVQWLHACPVDSPTAATEHQHHGSSPSESGQVPTCQCIGACNIAVVVSPARPLTTVAAVIQPDHHVIRPPGVSFIPVGTPSDLLPPATAPPA